MGDEWTKECPVCGKRYADSIAFCVTHGVPLFRVPLRVSDESAPAPVSPPSVNAASSRDTGAPAPQPGGLIGRTRAPLVTKKGFLAILLLLTVSGALLVYSISLNNKSSILNKPVMSQAQTVDSWYYSMDGFQNFIRNSDYRDIVAEMGDPVVQKDIGNGGDVSVFQYTWKGISPRYERVTITILERDMRIIKKERVALMPKKYMKTTTVTYEYYEGKDEFGFDAENAIDNELESFVNLKFR